MVVSNNGNTVVFYSLGWHLIHGLVEALPAIFPVGVVLKLFYGNQPRLSINNSGNVGIG